MGSLMPLLLIIISSNIGIFDKELVIEQSLYHLSLVPSWSYTTVDVNPHIWDIHSHRVYIFITITLFMIDLLQIKS
jgi:hypothetical protein